MHCSNEECKVEHIVVMNPAEPHEATCVLREDKIMFEEVPLSSLIQYRFSADSAWLLSTISVESLVFYRSSKFEIWKEMLMKGGNGCLVRLHLLLLVTPFFFFAVLLFFIYVSRPYPGCVCL